ncbi:proline-rich protein HaeIII subfamily 1-like [Canis lupus familiaris]|uniref:proline-rich protein HaeIII subfamily 1-like n=1 Tax=Canis lupus familiaris TaxID=9615 RepID=UPI0018F7C068|nr:proline-rich protein HaeIII subfamily 1-like [Canis lupus familiaris]
MWDPGPQSRIETFVFVVLTPYKALFLEACLTPPHPTGHPRAHPTPGVADPPSETGGKARSRQGLPGTATGRRGVDASSPLRRQGSAPGPSHAHPGTRARTAPPLDPLRPPPPRHDAPRVPRRPPAPPTPARSPRGPGSDGGGGAALRASGRPGRGAPPVQAPRPRSPAPSPALAQQLLPRRPSGRQPPPPPARSLLPSAGPPRVAACAGSPPGVTAPAAVSPHAGARGGARAARAPRPERAPRQRAPLPGSARRALVSPVAPRTRAAAAGEGPGTPRRAGVGEGRAPRAAPCRRCERRPSRAPSRVPLGRQHMLLCLGRSTTASSARRRLLGSRRLAPLRGPPPALPPGRGPRSGACPSQAQVRSPPLPHQ